MILKVCWEGLWTLSLGLAQFHGHGSGLVCEVALNGLLTTAIQPRHSETLAEL